MKLATIRTPSGNAAVRVDDDGAVEIGFQDVASLLGHDDWVDRARSGAGARHDLASLDFAPLVPAPSMTLCVGLNYLDHIAESGRERPEYPTLFPKFARTLIGAHDEIRMPRVEESIKVDWEAELAVVIGRHVRRADAQQARDAIAGYTIANDVSVRDYQFRTSEWLQGKAWEGTTPVGPVLLVDETGEAPEFDIECLVDGTVMQSSNTGELCFKPSDLVEYVSRFTSLAPGDLILTGTPSGIGNLRDPKIFLSEGQTVTTRVAGIGECVNTCAAWS